MQILNQSEGNVSRYSSMATSAVEAALAQGLGPDSNPDDYSERSFSAGKFETTAQADSPSVTPVNAPKFNI